MYCFHHIYFMCYNQFKGIFPYLLMAENAYNDVKLALFCRAVYKNAVSTKVYRFLELDEKESKVLFEERDLNGNRKVIGFLLKELEQLIPISARADFDLLKKCGVEPSELPIFTGED